ncbi:MAG: hypothetical protein WBC85_06630 [Planktotalea sp.]|uniref:hypothetical protein n=1 Tax=Planktotalea sp. TaxID=2029877 RepID=UPI003C734910
MTLSQWLITGGIVSLLCVSAAHSYFGERLLLGPMFKRRGNGVLDSDLARMVLRGAWHLTTVMWLQMAVILAVLGFGEADLGRSVLWTLGIGFLGVGVADMIWSKGRHIGWPILVAVGGFCFAAAWVN